MKGETKMKKFLVLALVIASIFAFSVPAMATGVSATSANLDWSSSGPTAPCIYSSTSSTSNLKLNLSSVIPRPTQVTVTYNSSNLKWPSITYSGTSGYIDKFWLNFSSTSKANAIFSSSTLKKGGSGQAEKNLQRALNSAGYSCTIDGIFGSGTQTALMSFQSANGLTSDGLAGAQTKAKLISKLSL